MRFSSQPAKPIAGTEPNALPWRMTLAVVWWVGFSLFFFTRPMPNLGGTFAETRARRGTRAFRGSGLAAAERIDCAGSGGNSCGLAISAGTLADLGLVRVDSRRGLGTRPLAVAMAFPARGTLPLERFVFAAGTGLSLVSLLTLGFGLIGFLHSGLFIGILSATSLAGLGSCFWSHRQRRKISIPSQSTKTSRRSGFACWRSCRF